MRGTVARGERIILENFFYNNRNLSFISKSNCEEFEYDAIPRKSNLNEADVLWEMLPHMKAAGLDKSLLDFIAGYAKHLQPNLNWD